MIQKGVWEIKLLKPFQLRSKVSKINVFWLLLKRNVTLSIFSANVRTFQAQCTRVFTLPININEHYFTDKISYLTARAFEIFFLIYQLGILLNYNNIFMYDRWKSYFSRETKSRFNYYVNFERSYPTRFCNRVQLTVMIFWNQFFFRTCI